MRKILVPVLMLLFFISPAAPWAALPDRLTPEETTWLESVRGRDISYLIPPKFIPISFVRDGQASGIVAEYIRIIEDRLNLNLKLLNVSWKEGMAMAKAGQVDLFPCLAWSKERERFIAFTKDHFISFSLVIVSQKEGRAIRKIEDLDGQRVAVDKDLVAYSKLVNDFSHLNIEFVFRKTVANVLKAVHLGEADACLSNSANAGYLISQNGWSNLKISGETGWNEVSLRMGVRKDWPLFLSVLEKTLADIPDATRKEITKKWIPVQFEHSFDSRYVLKRILPVLAGILAITLVTALFLIIVVKKNRQLNQAQSAIEAANRAKSRFLDNSGQGFLSFGPDLTVEAECSLECRRIFGRPVPGEPIQALLSSGDEPSRALLEKNFKRIFNETDAYRQSLYLSLMPPEFRLDRKTISAEYTLIDGPKMMLILTDITRSRELEDEVRNERNLLKFVVSTVRESQDFFDIVGNFQSFCRRGFPSILEQAGDPGKALEDIYRHVHTFKGLFSQQEFIHMPPFLHEIETRLSGFQENPAMADLATLTGLFDPETALAPDLDIIRDFLGEGFLRQKGEIVLTRNQADRITDMADDILNRAQMPTATELAGLMDEIRQIRHVPLKSLLALHCRGAGALALRLGKTIADVRVRGADVRVDPDVVAPFAKSLVHVFRNAVAHGIETPDERLETGKEEVGTLDCEIQSLDRHIVITIADDGRGMDVEKIRALAREQGLDDREPGVFNLISRMNFTTATTVTGLSGRGVGLSVVKTELDKLNGKADITTEPGKGTCFRFTIPETGQTEKGRTL